MVRISGSGSKWTNKNYLFVAVSGSGSLAITGGARVLSGGDDEIGADTDSHGAITVSGSGSICTTGSNLAVGYFGDGALAITGGGAVVADNNSYIGLEAGSAGAVTVSGRGSSWTTAGNLEAGDSGTGTLSITGGALVSVTGATTIRGAGTLEFDGVSTFQTGSLTVDGGTLRTLGAATFAPSATLGIGGMHVNSNGFDSTFSGNFGGLGGLAKSGSGKLTLTGASTYTGPTSVNAGALALTTSASRTASLGNTAITVAAGATLSATLAASPFSDRVNAGTAGSGTAGATLRLDPGSDFSMAGSSLATFNLRQESSFSGPAFTIGGAAGIAPVLTFDIGNAATGADLIHVTSAVRVLATGGDIAIDALAGDTSLTPGSYDLITSAGGFSGTDGNGLSLSGTTLAVDGAAYDLSLANSTTDDEVLTVSLDPPAVPAPHASFALEYTPDLLHNTPANPDFATADTATGGLAPQISTAAVPEPSTTTSLLAAFGVAAGWSLRRRRNSA